MKLEFTVWQFVRVMVELEQGPRRQTARPRQGFFARHASLWNELDTELEALAESDPAKYAKRMMKDTVVMKPKSAAHVLEVAEALGRVINQMGGGELRKGAGGDLAQRTNLQFERRELKKLRAEWMDLRRKNA